MTNAAFRSSDFAPRFPARRAHRPRSTRMPLGAPMFALAVLLGGAGATAAAAAEPAFYAIEKSTREATAGTASTASVAVVGKNGWHVNAEAPISLTLVADPGLTLAKAKLTRADLAETSLERARFEVAFTPSLAGAKKITGEARFVMCQEQACKPVKESVVLDVAVAGPGAAAGSKGAPESAAADARAKAAPNANANAKTKGKAKTKAAAPESW